MAGGPTGKGLYEPSWAPGQLTAPELAPAGQELAGQQATLPLALGHRAVPGGHVPFKTNRSPWRLVLHWAPGTQGSPCFPAGSTIWFSLSGVWRALPPHFSLIMIKESNLIKHKSCWNEHEKIKGWMCRMRVDAMPWILWISEEASVRPPNPVTQTSLVPTQNPALILCGKRKTKTTLAHLKAAPQNKNYVLPACS